MEGEDSLRTVNCLRGRLLAERMASRNAREKAEELGNKLVELENLLKEEAKSSRRAEKKLKFLMKRLESMNISYVTDESGNSDMLDKSDISSVSSTASSSRTKESEKSENLQMDTSTMAPMENVKSPKGSANSHISPNSAFEFSLAELKGQEFEMGSNGSPISPTFTEIFEQNYDDSTTDEQSIESSGEKGRKQDDDRDLDNHTDNSMALVPVEMPQKNQSIDPEVLDETVKEVLDALRHAKERLQSSMERRRMNNMFRVG